ncbi:MAG: hypothetical protein LR015_01585 [Verrucomicrobia bacterium]|nr:hypothetical protein [Verrucomicrobiota bacterium]
MDFFSAQDDALRRSKRLVYLFALAIFAIVLSLYAVVWLLLNFEAQPPAAIFDPALFAMVAVPVTLVILIASATKISQYSRAEGL